MDRLTAKRKAASLRAILLGGIAIGILAPMASAQSGAASGLAAIGPTVPLDRPLLLTRTVTRELSGGHRIVATRRYRVMLHRDGAGFRVEGDLVESRIEAPPSLAPLAEIERNRSDDGLFPIALDPLGRIVGSKGHDNRGGNAVERAIEVVLASADSTRNPTELRGFAQRIRALAEAGATAQWPAELFCPSPATVREEVPFALPGGGTGTIETVLETLGPAGAGLLGAAERRIVTTVDGDSRESRETFTLASDSPS